MTKVQKSLKLNFIYNTLLRLLNIIFPIITFPYIARVLTAEGIGKIDFSLSVIQYFILLSQIGIPTYAIRECSKYRDDKEKLSKVIQEILVINFFMTLLSYIIFVLILISVDKLYDYRSLLLILSLSIVFTNIGMEWFYQAIEEYRFIAIRSFIVKLVSLIFIFLLVHEKDDYIVYGMITVGTASLGYVYNFIYANKFIDIFKRRKNYNFKRHLKPILYLFAMSIATSIYINLDKVMLGFFAGDRSVGLYSAANKMVMIVLALVTSLGAVLLPRMSYYIENNLKKEVDNLIMKSLDFILLISIPMTVGLIMLAKPIIVLFAGQDYSGSISTLMLISPIILAIGLSNLIGIQILVAHGREKLTLISTICGALINFGLNLILIPKLLQNGAAAASLTAEIIVLIIQIWLARNFLKGNLNKRNLVQYTFAAFLPMIACYFITLITHNDLLVLIISIIISGIIYFSTLYYLKNQLVVELFKKVHYLIKNKYRSLSFRK